jgi:hypothetical protein
MQNAQALEVLEGGKVVGFDVSYKGANHRLMIGESYEGSEPINSAEDAKSWLIKLVDEEEARRAAR